jgi:hypothetical protein
VYCTLTGVAIAALDRPSPVATANDFDITTGNARHMRIIGSLLVG